MITVEQERELIVRAQVGDVVAAGELLEAHMGFWWSLARREKRDHDDALQEILLAAFQCIADFDLAKGVRFTTYAGPRARWRLGTIRGTNGVIRTPHAWNLKRCPSLRGHAKRARAVGSIDATTGDDVSFASLIPDDADPVSEHDSGDAIECVNWALAQLDERSATVVRARMNGLTLKEIGQLIGLTRERVRQIEQRAHERIASLPRLKARLAGVAA